MTYKYTYGGALIGAEEKKAINKVIDSNWWPSGEQTVKMEEEAAAYLRQALELSEASTSERVGRIRRSLAALTDTLHPAAS